MTTRTADAPAVAPGDVFVVGAPRSGTTWLHAVLSTHPSFASPLETNLFGLVARVEREYLLGRSDGFGPSWVIGDAAFDAWCAQLWQIARSGLLASTPRATRVLEKTPDHVLQIDLIRRLVGRARFVHVVRHPVDVVRSTLEASQSWASGWAPGTVEAATQFWIDRVRAGLAAGRTDDTLVVRYEDLLAGPEHWAELRSFLEIDHTWLLPDLGSRPNDLLTPAIPAGIDPAERLRAVSPEPRRSFHDRPTSQTRPLSAFEHRYVERHAGELLEVLGYVRRAPGSSRLDAIQTVTRAGSRRVRRVGSQIIGKGA